MCKVLYLQVEFESVMWPGIYIAVSALWELWPPCSHLLSVARAVETATQQFPALARYWLHKWAEWQAVTGLNAAPTPEHHCRAGYAQVGYYSSFYSGQQWYPRDQCQTCKWGPDPIVLCPTRHHTSVSSSSHSTRYLSGTIQQSNCTFHRYSPHKSSLTIQRTVSISVLITAAPV
jgi:hypothetical protein